mgnify:CR=1 FL=1
MLLDIQRRKTVGLSQKLCSANVGSSPKDQVSPSNSVDEQTISSSSSPLTSHGNSGFHVLEEVERLKKANMLLESELTCLRKLCSDLLLHIQKHAAGSTSQDIASLARFLQHRKSIEIETNEKLACGNEFPSRVDKGSSNSFGLSEMYKCDPHKLFPLQCRKRTNVNSSSVGDSQRRKLETPSPFHLMPMRMKHSKLSDNYE